MIESYTESRQKAGDSNMKAAVITKYGGPDAFRIQDQPEPSPRAGELQVRMQATSINPIDFKVRKEYMFFLSGFRFPKILGSDFAGIVEACGEGVSGFAVGDEVYGFNNGASQGSASAEVLCCKASVASKKPASLSFEEAAAVPLAASTTGSKGRKARFVMANSNDTDLSLMRQWCDEAKLRPLIEAVFPLGRVRKLNEVHL